MVDDSAIDWPDDLECGECGVIVGEDGVRIQYESLLSPLEPELYAWCNTCSPDTEEEEQELWVHVKAGDFREQAQSWDEY